MAFKTTINPPPERPPAWHYVLVRALTPQQRFALMLERLTTDRLWADAYEEFVHSVSFAKADEIITFSSAMESVRRLVEIADA